VAAEGGSFAVIGNAREADAYAPVVEGAALVRAPRMDAPALSALWYLARCGDLARAADADVLLLPAANRRLTARSPVPTVAVVHDLANLHVRRKYDILRMAYLRWVMLSALRTATEIVAVSQTTRDDLVNMLGATGERARVVPNGVDTARFAARDRDDAHVASARKEAGLETPYLLYPARLEHPGKNHVRLLTAYAHSALARTHRLALAGADWGAEDRIRREIARLGLEETVKLLGYISDEALACLVAGAEAILVVGLYEGFGLPALEGLAAGRPAVVSGTGAARESVGSLAVVCDPYDAESLRVALEQVVSDTHLRERAAREGPGWAATWTWDRTARGLLDACRAARGE
jgi:glycosyltransferase involved in cell wall biosynthesis